MRQLKNPERALWVRLSATRSIAPYVPSEHKGRSNSLNLRIVLSKNRTRFWVDAVVMMRKFNEEARQIGIGFLQWLAAY